MEDTNAKSISQRLICLDAFRGFTIVAMLLVNNKGSESAFHHQFHHAKWGEFPTFTDMIFPWFLLMVGCALPYSRASQFKRGISYGTYFFKCLKRAFLLILLGCLIFTSLNQVVTIQYGGVLQPIGGAFLCASFLYELSPIKRMFLTIGLLLSYAGLLLYGKIMMPSGSLEPGENIITYLNNTYFSRFNIQGITSLLPMTALVLIGTFVGEQMRSDKPEKQKLSYNCVFGVSLIIIGLVTHFVIPMSKDIWSSPYIIFSAGTGILSLMGFYYLIDILGIRRWASFFVVFGMNAITAYFLSIIIRIHTFQEWKWEKGGKTLWVLINDWFQTTAGNGVGAWLFTISYILLWWVILFWMYKKKIFWRV